VPIITNRDRIYIANSNHKASFYFFYVEEKALEENVNFGLTGYICPRKCYPSSKGCLLGPSITRNIYCIGKLFQITSINFCYLKKQRSIPTKFSAGAPPGPLGRLGRPLTLCSLKYKPKKRKEKEKLPTQSPTYKS
jgi:hypothetical protein